MRARQRWLHCLIRSFLRSPFTRAPEQDDPKKERHDEWDSRDSDNKTGTGVPWRRPPVRIPETSDHKEQQRDEGHDDECASRPASEPLDSSERSRKCRSGEIGQKARNKSRTSNVSPSETIAAGTSPACSFPKNAPNAKVFQMRYNGLLSMIAAKPRVA